MMNKRANISYKISQPGVVTCFHNVSTSELGNGKSIPHMWGKIVMNWVTSPPLALFSYLSPAQDCEVFCLEGWMLLQNHLETEQWRLPYCSEDGAGEEEGLESGWLCRSGRDFQGDLVWIDLQFILQPLFVMCFASSCTLNLNCSKLNYRDQTAHISIRTTKYSTKSHRDIWVPARMGLYIREEGEGASRKTFELSWIGSVLFGYKVKPKCSTPTWMDMNLSSQDNNCCLHYAIYLNIQEMYPWPVLPCILSFSVVLKNELKC